MHDASTNRRTFLRSLGAAGLALPWLRTRRLRLARPEGEPLRILMLGGTGFLGPHVVQAALDRGHEVTLFNRGQTNPELFPELEKLRGDRDPEKGDGLDALLEGEWDGVVDTSAYVPRIAAASAELLAERVAHYAFVSTLSVYEGLGAGDVDETSPVGTLGDPSTEQVDGTTYGPLKALCEQAVEAAMPGRVANVRPGLIVGPGDPTDRFTYWPARMEWGGEVLCPGEGDARVQYVDARDLAAFLVHTLEAKVAGVYNAVGPEEPLRMKTFLETCREVVGGDAELVWVEGGFLASQGVRPWSDMPMWLPGGGVASNERARAEGLGFRPLEETVRATLDWLHEEPEGRRVTLRAGISPEREDAVLSAWKGHTGR